MTDVGTLSLVALADSLAKGELTAEAVAAQTFDKIDALGEQRNIVVSLTREAAMEAARQCDKERARGAALGPLHGVPMMHKDLLYRRGEVCTAGSRLHADFVADHTSTVIERLEAAGSVTLGSLHTAEFGGNATGHNSYLGHCRNPWNPEHVTGGSSSGSAAAVARGLLAGSIGTDAGGSVRIPAALCGVTGLKLTQTRSSKHGGTPGNSVGVPGPLARTARDCARIARVISGHDPKDPNSSRLPVPDYEAALTGDIRGLRVCVPTNIFFDGVNEELAASFNTAMDVLRDLGAVVEEAELPCIDQALFYNSIIARVEVSARHYQSLKNTPESYTLGFRERIYDGFAVPATAYIEAIYNRPQICRDFTEQVFSKFDVIATLTTRTVAPTIAESDIETDPAHAAKHDVLPLNTRMFNYLAIPGISAPCGFAASGLPIGLQIMARPFAEGRVLNVAHAYQSVTDHHLGMPTLK